MKQKNNVMRVSTFRCSDMFLVIISCVVSFLPVWRCSCYNCGGLDHHAKECGLPPQPKKCHYCQSITHMVAQCPHKALVPGSQDQHASTSAFSPGTGPYLCPPDEEERSGSSPLEGSSSSPEESHTRGPRTQRWRKSWKQPIEVNLSPLNPWPSCFPSIKDISIPHHPRHLPHTCEKNGRSWFLYFYFLFVFHYVSNQRSYGDDHRGTDVRECVWLTCSRLVQLRQPALEWWLQGVTVFLFFFLFQSVLVERETTWYESWFHDLFFVFFPHFCTSWTFCVGRWSNAFHSRLSSIQSHKFYTLKA